MQDSSKPNPNGKNLQTPIMYIVFFGAGIKICICCGSGSTVNFERCVFEYLHVSMHDFFLVHLWMLKISLSFWSGWITVAKTEDLQHFYSTQPKHGDQRYWEWMGMAGIPHSYFGPQRVTKWAWNYSWKWPIEKEIRSSNLQCSGDMLVFRGVRYLYFLDICTCHSVQGQDLPCIEKILGQQLSLICTLQLWQDLLLALS